MRSVMYISTTVQFVPWLEVLFILGEGGIFWHFGIDYGYQGNFHKGSVLYWLIVGLNRECYAVESAAIRISTTTRADPSTYPWADGDDVPAGPGRQTPPAQTIADDFWPSPPGKWWEVDEWVKEWKWYLGMNSGQGELFWVTEKRI